MEEMRADGQEKPSSADLADLADLFSSIQNFVFKLSHELKLKSPAGKVLLHSSFSCSSFNCTLIHLRGHSLVYFRPVALLHSRFAVRFQLLYNQRCFFKILMAENNGDATTPIGN